VIAAIRIRMHPYCVSGTVQPQNHFFSIGTQLREFHAAGSDHDQLVDRLILREEFLVASKLRDPGIGNDLVALLWGESCEKRRLNHERTLRLGIGPIQPR
jgi:hypothetical protein